MLGKYKTIVQIFGLSMLLFQLDLIGIPIYKLGMVLTAIATVLTLWSMILYLRLAWPELRNSSNL
jgi:phosphatidylglycerophosphate synthase